MSALELAGRTDTGCVRERNEDSLAVEFDIGLLVVADGMGGHNSGEVASRTAVDTIVGNARKMLGGSQIVVPEGGEPGRSVRARQLEYLLKLANTVIFEKARAFPKDHGMGTTVVAVLADEKSLTVAHVGDSRLYLRRGGTLQQLTEDHSLVMEQVRHGLITREQAEASNLQNILTRALGTDEQVQIDVSEHPLLAGDTFLICSDGLTKMVSEADISDILAAASSADDAVERLIASAREAGGADNITAVVARLSGPHEGIRGFFSRLFGG
ncbi:MAG: Stp1/IreP family PP2C-type Ser/Thr phosphatase [Elusimicrobiota bacterium]